MLKTTESFNSNIKNMWGSDDNRATRIAKEAMNELFRHGEEISLDYDDQTGFALKVGILAGRTENGTPEDFITAFSNKILNEGEE